MTTASEMSDAELLAGIAMPALVAQESGGRAGVLGPQTKYGRAQGMTQMLPATAEATARKIGMDWRPELMTGTTPEAADYQQALGEAYLREGIETTGNLQDGFRYYHGGPDRKQWGPKTNAYAEQVMGRVGQGEQPSAAAGMSDEELMAALGEQVPPEVTAEVEGRPDLGVGVAHADNAPKPPPRLPVVPQRLPQRQGPTIAQDAASGAAQPWQNLGHTVMEGYRDVAADGRLSNTFIPRLAGDVVGLASTPLMAAVRPAARAINRNMPAPHAFNWGAWNGSSPFRKLEGEEAQAHVEGALNTALSGVRPATPRPVAAPKVKPMTVDDLRTAKSAAYEAVENMGVAYAPKATAKLADAITGDLTSKRINPKITPRAHAIMEDIQATLKAGKPVSLTEIDQLRQATWLATGKGDDAEKFFGDRITRAIDDFIDTAGPESLSAKSVAIADEAGEPVTFYHGSPRADLRSLEPTRREDTFDFPPVVSLSTDPKFAAGYAGPSGRVYKGTVHTDKVGDYQNPKDVERVIDFYKAEPGFGPDDVERIKHGVWTYWENKDLWKKNGWEGAWNREQPGRADAGTRNLSLANSDHINSELGPNKKTGPDLSAPEVAQAIRNARELNKRYRKVQTVENEVDSATLRASSTYAGGNKANAIRQELRPLIDKTSKKRFQSLSKEEEKALRRVVDGSGGANAARVVGKLLDPRGLLGATLQGAGAMSSSGLSLASVPLGMLGSSMSNRATLKSVDELLKLLSTGPKPKALPQKSPMSSLAGPAIGPTQLPKLSPRGVIGAGATAAPLTRIPAPQQERKTGTSARRLPQRTRR